jgi:nicotinamidase-related amidase
VSVRPGLLLIDMQREFLDGLATTPPLADAVDLLQHVAGLFREAGRPVFFVHDVESCPPGSPGYPFVEGLTPAAGDVTVDKLHGDAFRDTDLSERLSERGVDFLVIGGFKAEACVLSTLKGAEARDLRHALLRGGIVSDDPEAVRFVERISPLASHQVVEALLETAAGD